MKSRLSQRSRCLLALGIAALTATLLASCREHSSGANYQPAASEKVMFQNLRSATPTEQGYAGKAMASLQEDTWNTAVRYDTYVAKGDFRTVYTTHHMVVLVSPGAKWLGGPLGQVTLVFRVHDDQYEKSWEHSDKTLRMIREFSWATVVYDPLCRAYNLGFATLEACRSTPDQRHSVTATDQHLRALSADEHIRHDVRRRGPWTVYDWTVPTGSSTAFVATPHRAKRGNDAVLFGTVILPGQKISGGELGSRTVVVPTQQRVHLNDVDTRLQRIEIIDTLAKDCSAIQPYLGPELLQRYALYCD